MNKRISIIIAVLIVLFGIYWFSPLRPLNRGANETSSNDPGFIKKGPLGIAQDPDGKYLVDTNGRTLYAKVSDAATNKNTVETSCDAECEKVWLPYLVSETEPGITASDDELLSKLNIFIRADEKKQYALGNQPLYQYAGDTKLGDMEGATISGWMTLTP